MLSAGANEPRTAVAHIAMAEQFLDRPNVIATLVRDPRRAGTALLSTAGREGHPVDCP